MSRKLSSLEKMLIVSIGFNMLMLAVRMLVTKELTYGFYVWNTFLAVLPVVFSHLLQRCRSISFRAVLCIIGWLGFFPNAPYIITDLIHYLPDPHVPQWYDLTLVITAAWNGLLLGVVSLMQVEQFLSQHLKPRQVQIAEVISCVLCGYGVYIGRYLRFNTWDTITDPASLITIMLGHFFMPFHYKSVWAFTLLFGAMFAIVYYTLKQLRIKSVAVS